MDNKEQVKEHDRQLYKIFRREWKKGNKVVILQYGTKGKPGKEKYTVTYKAYPKMPGNWKEALHRGMKVYNFTEWTEKNWEEMKSKLWGDDNDGESEV